MGSRMTRAKCAERRPHQGSLGYRQSPLRSIGLVLGVLILSLSPMKSIADVDLPTKFSNLGGITNTRHNLTQSPIGSGAVNMNPYRNEYGEVCVYCHTPHGANVNIDLPLWNRTYNALSYTTYDNLNTSSLTQTVTQPGINSLACLSCHDGTLGGDSIINMPGSGNYDAGQQSTQSNSFLSDNWTNASGPDASVHVGLAGADTPASEATGCLACHSTDAGIVGAGATDFKIFVTGTDLTNDHPVGISLPTQRVGIDFNDPAVKQTGIAFFDLDADSHADSDEIRFYDTGEGYEVECASCHDPHGVRGPGNAIIRSFLRVENDDSDVCMTCHNM